MGEGVTGEGVTGEDASADFQPWCESHYTLWSPIDDGRQVVLSLFCGWFEAQQAWVQAGALPWGKEALQACPLSLSFIYACVRAVIDEKKGWFGLSAPLPLSRLASQRNSSLDTAALMKDDAWLGSVAASINSKDPLPTGSQLSKQVFPNLPDPDEAFTHFRLEGLGHAFASRLSRDFAVRCRTRLAAAPPFDSVSEAKRIRFSPLQRLATRSFLLGTAGAAVISGLITFIPLLSGHSPWTDERTVLGAAAGLYAAEFPAFLHAAWAAGRAGVAILMIQYLFFLKDKQRVLLYLVTEKAAQTITRECAAAWSEVASELDAAHAKAIATEYTLVGMRPLDYARDGLIEKYQLAGLP